MKTALVTGATGLVGGHLVRLLLSDKHFHKVVVFSRRSLGINDPKLEEHIINFDAPDTWRHLVKGEVLFSTLGTTLKQAGSKQAQYKIDYTYQYQFAETASRNKVPVYILVSSSGADPDASIFYSRMKGELERDVQKLPFSSIYLLQPSLLVGKRREERIGEKTGYVLLKLFNSLGLFRKYQPIHGETVARAMVNASIEVATGIHVCALDNLFSLAGKSTDQHETY